MKPTTAAALALALILGASAPLAAADKPSRPLPSPAINSVRPSAIEKGDQSIGLAISLNAPLFVLDGDLALDGTAAQVHPGAAFTVTYQYYLDRGFNIGGSLSGSFHTTYGGNNFILMPISFRSGYTWLLNSFEIGAGAEAGAFFVFYNGQSTLGPFAKVGASASWRVANAWSVGLDSWYWLSAELHSAANADLTRIGNAVTVGLTATYHL